MGSPSTTVEAIAPAPVEADAHAKESLADAVVEQAESDDEDDVLVMEPYIETELCTSCNECTDLNRKMFQYDENKQAYIADPRAGTFAELVRAAEQCPAAIIHPGTPLDPNEPDLDKWIERAAPFN
jgi:ferredoxin